MKNEITNLLEIIGLASKLIDVFVETTTVISKKVIAFEQDNAIKDLVDMLKIQAATMKSKLAVLRGELANAQSKANEPNIMEDAVKTPLPSDVNTIQTEMQAELAKRDEKKIPPILFEEKADALMESGAAVADKKASPGIKQEAQKPLNAEAKKPRFTDEWQEELESAAFPNAKDKIVFTEALSCMDSQDVALRLDAAKALAGIHHELAARALAGQMAREQSVQVRQECIRSLTKLEMKEGVALAAVENALNDPSARVRLVAVWGLYRLKGAESVPALTRMLSDEEEEIRRRAITCISWLAQEQAAVGMVGNLGSQLVVSSLIRCLKDPEKSVRTAALDTLEAVTGKKMTKQLPAGEDSHQDIIAKWQKWWQQELLG